MTITNYVTNTRSQVTAITNAIRGLGWEVPAEIAAAQRASYWRPNVDGQVGSAQKAVAEAKTEAEFQAAATDLAKARALQAAGRDPAFINDIDGIHQRTLIAATGEHVEDLFERAVAEYNKHTDVFTTAVRRLPDMANVRPIDLTVSETSAIAEARSLAVNLDAALSLYSALCKFSGYDHGLAHGDKAAAIEFAWHLGEFTDWNQIEYVTKLLMDWSWRDDLVYANVGPIAPHGLVVLAGGRLELMHPDDALGRRIKLQASIVWPGDWGTE